MSQSFSPIKASFSLGERSLDGYSACQSLMSAPNFHLCRAANTKMKFHPHRGLVAILGVCSLTCSLMAASYWFHSRSLLTLLSSIFLLMIAVYFIGPVFKNQIIEMKGEGFLLHSFGRKIELDVDNLYEIVERQKGIKSYCFRKNGFEYQVTPHAYHDSIQLQEQFDQLFEIEN